MKEEHREEASANDFSIAEELVCGGIHLRQCSEREAIANSISSCR